MSEMSARRAVRLVHGGDGGEEMNKRVMIALVSDQRMQNVIPVFQNGARYDEIILVISKDRSSQKPLARYDRSANDLKTVFEVQNLQVTISDQYVDPFDIQMVQQAVEALVVSVMQKGEVVVNISGGTKTMAIGALQAARRVGVPCLYTNMEDGQILWLNGPSGSAHSESIIVRNLDVSSYIRAYGEEVITGLKVSDLDHETVKWANYVGEQHSVLYKDIIRPINDAIKKGRHKTPIHWNAIRATRNQRKAIEFLAAEGLWRWDSINQMVILEDSNALPFLFGGWVEIYAATKLYESGFFDDVRLNVKLKGIDGEIDVVAVGKGKLVLVECKSNVQRSEQLSKLDSFRNRLGGSYAKAYYVRAGYEDFRRIEEQCKKFRLDQAFFGPEIQQLGKQIGERLGLVS
jgi:hypothetical protein